MSEAETQDVRLMNRLCEVLTGLNWLDGFNFMLYLREEGGMAALERALDRVDARRASKR